MLLTHDNKIIKKPLHSFYEEETFELPKRLMEKNYATPFNVLKNCVFIRTSAIVRNKLTSDYIHLVEQE